MQRQRKLLLSFMIWGFVLLYGTAAATALTTQEIAKITLGSTVHLGVIDANGKSWTGSGFVIRDDQIVTNYHVIDNMSIGGARLVGKEDLYPIEATLAVEKNRDLAIIKVVGIDVPALSLGDSDTVQIGDQVYVAGNPQGLEGSFSDGIISAIRGGSADKFFQMTAPISQGSSGGPVVNEKGEVIGVSFATLLNGQNLNFAIPVNYLRAIMPPTPPPIKPKPVKAKVDPPPAKPKPTKRQADLPSAEPKPALTPQEIKKIANSSMVLLSIIDSYGKRGRASGFVVHDGYIATNYHVVENVIIGRAKLVGKKKWHSFIGPILMTDEDHDLAIVKVAGMNASALLLGDSDTVKIGKTIYVAGNPSGPEGRAMEGTVTIGSIRNIRIEDILMGGKPLRGKKLQIDASIEPGSSGGPVLNDSGEVIGVSVGGYSGVGEEEYVPLGYNYAIAVNHLKHLAKRHGIPITSPEIPPIMKHVPPSRVSVGDTIPLTLNLTSSKTPQQVTIHYTIYDKNRNRLEQNNQKMRLGNQQSASSTRVYKVDLPSQNHIGSIEYYITVEYQNDSIFRQPSERSRHYEISIVDEKPPTISLLYPPPDSTFGANQEITFRAKVTDNLAVKDVHIHISSRFNDPQSHKLTAQGSSNIYTIDITLENIITLQYYLTATDEEGNEGRSKYRHLEIRITSQENLEKGIKLYEQARYREAIKALSSAVRELKNPKQRAEAYLYLGGSKRGIGEGNEKVREQFQESIRHNPNQKLPPRVGKDHPIFAELLEEVRKELTGELTVISLLPQTEIWIEGNKIDRKMLGTGIVSSRLLTGNYIVEAIYAEKSQRKTVTIESDRHKVLDLGIPPTVEHDPPPRISVGERVPLTLDLISTKSPQQVKIYYKTYDRDKDELEQNNQEMRLWGQQSAPSTWVYKVDLPAQKHVGSIEYYIEIEYDNHLVFRHPRAKNHNYQISIVDEKPPTIFPPDPPNVGSENESEPESSRIRTPTEGEGNESKPEPEKVPQGEPPDDPPSPPSTIYQGIWASVSADDASTFDRDGSYMFRLAYLLEGKNQSTLGAQLDFSYPDRTNMSAMVQWGPRPPGKSKITFTLLGGIAAYEDSPRPTHTTPIFGGGVKLYPRDRIVIDATGSIQLQQGSDTMDLYHYEVGIRFYITPRLNLRAGYGQLYLGDRNVSTIQVGLGYTF